MTFGATDTEQTFTLAATDDTDADAGESVALSFGTLPAGRDGGNPVRGDGDDRGRRRAGGDDRGGQEAPGRDRLRDGREGTAGFTLSRTGSTAATLTVTVEVTQEVDRDLLPDGADGRSAR